MNQTIAQSLWDIGSPSWKVHDVESVPEWQKALQIPAPAGLPVEFSHMSGPKYNHMKQRERAAAPCWNLNQHWEMKLL